MAKNIVLLSDGTGNSAAKLLKTNVWRVYEALQLTDPTVQVACYDDGVGTSSFRPLALAGGAFGVGLRRNVLRLYRFLCEHYDPGDRIYLFGFSRGAFTIRVLAGLICDQGIIKTRPTLPVEGTNAAGAAASRRGGSADATAIASGAALEGLAFGRELGRLAGWAYRDFRRHFNQTGGLVTLARAFRDSVVRASEYLRRLPSYDRRKNHEVTKIDFVGVWDTVDAYGMPIDELTHGVDRWVWPLSMPDLTLNSKVNRACHVLALDDERNTFHPVLWDESGEPPERAHASHIGNERISQVWFAGMHSNVGGGYPDDALSYVSLKWMTDQASDRSRGLELLFVPALLEHHTKKADPFGRLYDSRQGLKGYYRYNPRRLEWLTNGQAHEHGYAKPTVTIPQPKIHESVFRRIAAAPEAYAPIVFPRNYAVLMDDGRILKGDANPYETSAAGRRRALAQEGAWDLVWQRRVIYFATVAVSLYLLIKPLRAPVTPGTLIELGPVARLLGLIASVLPAMAAPWVRYYQAHPVEFVVGVTLVLLLMRRGRTLQARICGTMRGIWLKVVPPAREEWMTLRRSVSRLTRIRSHSSYQWSFAILRRKILPNAFGLLILAWLAGAANRAPFEILHATGVFGCENSLPPPAVLQSSQPVSFASSGFCNPSGIQLERGARYRLEFVTALPENWKDGGVRVRSPAGVTSRSPGLSLFERAVFTAGVPFRRVWSADWFVPVARIGKRGIDHYPLTRSSNEITARTSGELFLFVNDSIAPLNVLPFGTGWKSYYANNDGRTEITVTKITGPPQVAAR